MRKKTSFIVYKIETDEPLFLVCHRQGGIWQYPTAKVEKGESYIDCAFREIKEELGKVTVLNFTDLKTRFRFSSEHGEFEESVVAFEIKEVAKLQKEEFDEAEFLLLEEALKRVHYDSHKTNLKKVAQIIKAGKQSRFFIFVAPTACGKSVIIKHLLETYPDKFERVKTYMTREFKRAEDALLRIHVSEGEFESLDKRGLLIEKNYHDGNWYGSSFKLIENSLKSGKNLLAEVDINGLKELKKHFHNIVSIFISAPIEEIEYRLRERGGHDEKEVGRRLEIARQEIAQKDFCDEEVVNLQGKLPQTITNVEKIIEKNLRKKLIEKAR